jgi:hypothetical protein
VITVEEFALRRVRIDGDNLIARIGKGAGKFAGTTADLENPGVGGDVGFDKRLQACARQRRRRRSPRSSRSNASEVAMKPRSLGLRGRRASRAT